MSCSLSGAVIGGFRDESCGTNSGGGSEARVATGGSNALPGLVRGGGICGFSCRSQVRCCPRLFFVVIEVGVAMRGGHWCPYGVRMSLRDKRDPGRHNDPFQQDPGGIRAVLDAVGLMADMWGVMMIWGVAMEVCSGGGGGDARSVRVAKCHVMCISTWHGHFK